MAVDCFVVYFTGLRILKSASLTIQWKIRLKGIWWPLKWFYCTLNIDLINIKYCFVIVFLCFALERMAHTWSVDGWHWWKDVGKVPFKWSACAKMPAAFMYVFMCEDLTSHQHVRSRSREGVELSQRHSVFLSQQIKARSVTMNSCSDIQLERRILYSRYQYWIRIYKHTIEFSLFYYFCDTHFCWKLAKKTKDIVSSADLRP